MACHGPKKRWRENRHIYSQGQMVHVRIGKSGLSSADREWHLVEDETLVPLTNFPRTEFLCVD